MSKWPWPAQAEQDHALLARLRGVLGLLDHRADRVRGLGAGDDRLRARERSAAANVSFCL